MPPPPRWGSGRCWRRRCRSKAAISSPASRCRPAARPAGRSARRRPRAASLPRRIAERRRHTQAILDQADRDPQAAVRLLAQAGDLTRGLGRGQRRGNPLSAGRPLCVDWPRRLGGGGVPTAGGPVSGRSALPAGPGLAGAILCQRRGGGASRRRLGGRRSGRRAQAAGSGRGRGHADRARRIRTCSRSRRCDFPWPPRIASRVCRSRRSGLYLMQGNGGKGDAWSACAAGRNLVGPAEGRRRPSRRWRA